VTWEIKAKTKGSSDPHARYHHRDWLAVITEGNPTSQFPILRCICSCGNEVYVHTDQVYRRREVRRA